MMNIQQENLLKKVHILLGDASGAFSEDQLRLCIEMAQNDLETYLDKEIGNNLRLTNLWLKMTMIRIERLNNEAIQAQSFSGQNETFIDGYPDDIQEALKKLKRRVRVL